VIFWHTGLTTVIVWFVMRGNPRVDYRIVAVASLLPDIIDKPIGRIVFRSTYDTGHLWGHTLLLNVALFAVMFSLRGRIKRKLTLLPISSLLHLAEDGMWSSPKIFWWPLFGTHFPPEPITGMYPSWGMLAQEAIGLGLILFLFAAHHMLSLDGLKSFVRSGHLVAAA
jgi:hypothetical protein